MSGWGNPTDPKKIGPTLNFFFYFGFFFVFYLADETFETFAGGNFGARKEIYQTMKKPKAMPKANTTLSLVTK